MKVALFTPFSPNMGGGAAQLYSLVLPLEAQGIDVTWLYLGDKDATYLDFQEVPLEPRKFIRIGTPLMGGSPWEDLRQSIFLWNGVMTKGLKRVMDKICGMEADLHWIVAHNEGILIASALARLNYVPVHLTIHDDVPSLFARSRRYRFISDLAKTRLKEAMDLARTVDVTSEEMRAHYKKTLGIDSMVVHPHLPSLPVFEAPPIEKRNLVIGCAGAIYSFKEFRSFCEALQGYAKNNTLNAKVVLIGTPPERVTSDLREYSQMITSIPRLSERETVRKLANCNFLYAMYPFDQASDVFRRTSFQTKLFAYIQAGRPIFAHTPDDSTLARFVRRYDVGISCDSLRAFDIIESIRKIIRHELSADSFEQARAETFGQDNINNLLKCFTEKARILVSHPGKQYVQHLLFSLQRAGLLTKFITSIWYKPKSLPYNLVNLLPSGMRRILENELKKRYYDKLNERYIEEFPAFELLYRITEPILSRGGREKFMYLLHNMHDRYVSRRLKKIEPDVIIGYENSSLRTFREARRRGIITVLDFSQVHYKFIDALMERYEEFKGIYSDKRLIKRTNLYKEEELENADYIIALSDFAKKTLTDNGIRAERIYKSNLGVDLSTFKKKTIYKKDGIFKILYTGSITKRKGITILLEAYRQLNLKKAQLILTGGMADGKDVLKRYSGTFKYIPHLHHAELASAYQDADIFVLPSYLDSWGMVVIEAMASGTPVIVSENTGAKEAVHSGQDGFVIPVADVDALKEKMLFFYEDRERIGEFGNNARCQAEKYSWESYYAKISAIMKEVYKGR